MFRATSSVATFPRLRASSVIFIEKLGIALAFDPPLGAFVGNFDPSGIAALLKISCYEMTPVVLNYFAFWASLKPFPYRLLGLFAFFSFSYGSDFPSYFKGKL
jgi:hypothetical protein